MREADWQTFRYGLPGLASERLTAILESFVETGEGDLPGNSFRWFTPGRDEPAGVRSGAFEAHGVVLHGRRAAIGGLNAFFVQKITIDDAEKASRKLRKIDERQVQLPLD